MNSLEDHFMLRRDQDKHIQPFIHAVDHPEGCDQPKVVSQFQLCVRSGIYIYDYAQDEERETINE
jgi:hypothetical protein